MPGILAPTSLEPRDLFELLIDTRPTVELDFRFKFAEDVRLFVQAPSPRDWREILKRKRITHLVATALVGDDGKPIFADVKSAGLLSADDITEAVAAVEDALDVCAPTFARSDQRSWERALAVGARDSGHRGAALAHCVDVAGGPGGTTTLARPERFWGLPVGDLLDGHWMAFFAARKAFD